MRAVIAGLVVVLCAGVASAATTRKVPSEAYPTIQSAVDAADEGDTILVSKKKDGTPYEEWVETAKSLKFIGKRVVWEGTRLDGGGYGRCLSVSGGAPADGVVVQGFTFRHGSEHVYIYGNDALVQSCTFSGAFSTSVYIDGAGAVVQKCTFRGNNRALEVHGDGALAQKNSLNGHGYGGIYVYGSGASLLGNRCARSSWYSALYVEGALATVSGNTVTDGYEGIYVSGDESIVEKNRISRVGGSDTGIDVVGRGVSVLSNQVSQVGGSGIYVSGNSGSSLAPNLVEGNTVSWTDGTGIYTDGWTATIRRNAVSLTGYHGIECTYWTGDSGSTVEGNTVSDSFENGIFVGGGGWDVVGNRIQRAAGYGIFCSGDSYATPNSVRDNQVREFYYGGIYMGASYAGYEVAGNVVTDGLGNATGIYVYNYYGLAGTVRGNTVNGTARTGINVYSYYGATGAVIEDNTIAGAGTMWDYGVYYYGYPGGSATISKNAVSGQMDAGIYAYGSGCSVDANSVKDCFRAGIAVGGSDMSVTGNTVFGGEGEGFVNWGTGTVLTGNTFLGNRLDVANSDSFATPDIGAVNTFETGGAGVAPQVYLD